MKKLFVTAISHISSSGVDSLSVSALVKEAGISRPTFYSHFGDVDGLLAELWLEYYHDWCLAMFDPADSRPYVVPESPALWQIFLVAHRSPQVEEAVQSSLRKLIEESFPDRADRTLALWAFANRLGILASRDVWPEAENAISLDGYLMDVSGKVTHLELLNAEELPAVGPQSPGSDHEKIILATLQIVQRSGVHSLSVARLGRVLRVTSGFIYPRISTREALVAEAFAYALTSAHQSNISRWKKEKLGIEGFAEFLVGGLGHPRTNWRRFRGEVLLAARASEALHEPIRKALDEFSVAVQKETKRLPVPREVASTLSVLVHTLLFGFSSLHSAGIDVRNLAHQGIIRSMVLEIGRRVLQRRPLLTR